MKTLTTMTAVAALLAGIAIASAQSPAPTQSPSSMNKGTDPAGPKSGAQSGSSATMSGPAKKQAATGSGKFCVEMSKGGGLECKYASMDACQKDAQPQHLNCSPNPNAGTTGAK